MTFATVVTFLGPVALFLSFGLGMTVQEIKSSGKAE